MEEAVIINRVSKSALEVIDLKDFRPQGKRMALNPAAWLEEPALIREKSFRDRLKNHAWEAYKDAYVAILPLGDMIVPGWTYPLIASYLSPVAREIVLGDLAQLEAVIYREAIFKSDFSRFRDKSVIIKGCDTEVPQDAYVSLLQKLIPISKSIAYGEACSSIPIFKQFKNQ